ncbi:MAG: DUF2589 domain-containing protein [Paludibacteraceae bacterium]|nr:DUF2589 domain-containing protein [Paludibacteraceae bacterium]
MAKGIDTTASTVATNALQAIPFGSIIGGPMSACIEAQTNAAKTTLDYIKEVGLTTDEDGNSKAVYVSFEYRKNGHSSILSIPLLTIVPIPYFAIKDIDIAFKASISAASSLSTTESSSLEVGASLKAKAGFNLGLFKGSMEMSASVSSKKDSSATRDSKYSVEYTMDVAVKAGQDDMPAGMSKVLEMLSESIDTIVATGELTVSSQKISTADGGVYVTYKNVDGYYAPSDIAVYKSGGTEPITDNSICKLVPDKTGAVCLFYTAGSYEIKAGENSTLVTVTE